MSDQKITARICRVIKTFYQSVFCRLIKIDHNIPAENNVEFEPELDGIHQVECPENDVGLNLRRYGIDPGLTSLTEIFGLPGWGEFL